VSAAGAAAFGDGAFSGGAAPTPTDVLVIGGGPAGSTAAALLARRGYQVTLLEKDHHPRFHIGESLLPANLRLFEQLGVAEQMRAIGLEKRGVEFVRAWDGRHRDFRFTEAWDRRVSYAYHVRRSQFDQILFDNAARAGAQALQDCRVRSLEFLPRRAGVRVSAAQRGGTACRWQARLLIDASGRDTFLATQLGCKRRNPRHNSAALFAHFGDARRHQGERAGYISLYWFEHGWCWFIPLRDGVTSVGAVVWPYYLKSRSVPVREFFLATIAACPPLAERLEGASLLTEVTATGNYSYSATRSHGDNYLLIGDAFTFIDPVFSSGVLLAMNGAFAAAEAADTCLRQPRRARAALRRFDAAMRRGPRQFSWFIYRITQPDMIRLFLQPRNALRMRAALVSLLAGDIFGSAPRRAALCAFKLMYALMALAHPRRSARDRRRRRLNIRPS
jgi:flavin-dependent dehydrogenase